jgi:hypothetical protein
VRVWEGAQIPSMVKMRVGQDDRVYIIRVEPHPIQSTFWGSPYSYSSCGSQFRTDPDITITTIHKNQVVIAFYHSKTVGNSRYTRIMATVD